MMTESLPIQGISSGSLSIGPTITQFGTKDFIRRVDRIAELTDDYGGKLREAWERTRDVSDVKPQVDIPVSSSVGDDEHIFDLLQRIRNSHVRSVVLETAHAYMYDDLGSEAFRRSLEIQCQQAQRISDGLEATGILVKKLMFVDDYNPKPGTDGAECTLDLDAYLQLAADNGFPPDMLIMEGDLAKVAREMVDFMHREQGIVIESGGNNGNGKAKVLEHRNIELVKDNGMMTCSALDATLSLLKYRYVAQGLINVLPRQTGNTEIGFSFRGQQAKVRGILSEHLGVRAMPYFNAFVSVDPEELDTSGAHHALWKDVGRRREPA